MPRDPRNRPRLEDEPTPPLQLVHFNELGEPVETDRLVRGFLGEKTLGVIFGAPKSGKSFFVTDMALAVARGIDWFGRRVERGAVLTVAAEGHEGYLNRLRAYRLRHHLEREAVPFVVVPKALQLDEHGETARQIIAAASLVQARYNLPVRLVVIDTVARTLVGDENGAGDMSTYVRQTDLIREQTGATVVLVHHEGKDQARGARGSNALRGAADTMIRVELEGGIRTASLVDQKDGPDGESITFGLDPVELGISDDFRPIVSCVVVPANAAPMDGPQLGPSQRLCLEALTTAVTDCGKKAPFSRDIPSWALVVTYDDWFDRAGKMRFSSASGDNLRRAFDRILNQLRDRGLVGAFGEWCWLARRDQHGSRASAGVEFDA